MVVMLGGRREGDGSGGSKELQRWTVSAEGGMLVKEEICTF